MTRNFVGNFLSVNISFTDRRQEIGSTCVHSPKENSSALVSVIIYLERMYIQRLTSQTDTESQVMVFPWTREDCLLVGYTWLTDLATTGVQEQKGGPSRCRKDLGTRLRDDRGSVEGTSRHTRNVSGVLLFWWTLLPTSQGPPRREGVSGGSTLVSIRDYPDRRELLYVSSNETLSSWTGLQPRCGPDGPLGRRGIIE